MGGSELYPGEAPPEGLGALCLACDGALTLAPDCYPLVFRCEGGHLFTLNDLLDFDFPRGKVGPGERPWLTLQTWEARARALREASGRALRDGHVLAAADFKEAAGRIARWTYSLKTLLGSESPPAAARD